MFDFVHLEQEEGWRQDGLASATHFNPSRSQQEHGDGMISPSNTMGAMVWARTLKERSHSERTQRTSRSKGKDSHWSQAGVRLCI